MVKIFLQSIPEFLDQWLNLGSTVACTLIWVALGKTANMAGDFKAAIADFGGAAKQKLANPAIDGAPEDQLRAPLEVLIKVLASLSGLPEKSVELVGETTLAGLQIRPDFAVSVHKALTGFIEVKAPGKGANPGKFTSEHDKEQWKKLKSLPNLLYTDGNSFSLWRSGELEGKIITLEGDIATSGAKLRAPEALLALISDFLRWQPIAPKNPKQLAKICAKLCRLLREEVVEQLGANAQGFKTLAKDWRDLLFPDATDERFADGYAQAVTFGLLMARAYDINLSQGIEHVAVSLRKSNTLIGTALRLLTDNEENQQALKTSLATLMRVLNVVNWHDVSKDKPEAWLYFYEDFLQDYDNVLRKQTGSYYTPPEVVEAMVRLVDEALKGPLFKRPLGLASPDVTIADPAMGTGTFLLGVLRQMAENIAGDMGAGSVAEQVGAAAQRLFGFELQFGPFAVAQLRLLAEMRTLAEKGGEVAEKDIPALNLYVTDTLSNPFVEEEQLPQMVEAVAKSRRDANKVKRQQQITVVIGNPPYKNKAAGMGGWIEKGSEGRASAMEWWQPPSGWGLGAHTHHLKNLYVYFWRWAALKVFGSGWHDSTGEPDKAQHGVVCYISASGFLNGPGFARMREDLRREASEIWVIDCSPEGHQPDIPTRIFEGVQQPVCIVMAARAAGKNKSVPAKLHCLTLPEGKRKGKFAALAKIGAKSNWAAGPQGWREPFLIAASGQWADFPSLANLFNWAGPGVTPHRTWPIAPDVWSLESRWQSLVNEKDLEAKQLKFSADDDRDLQRLVKGDLAGHPTRKLRVGEDKGAVVSPVRYAWRSFDRQWIIPDHRLLSRARPKIWDGSSVSQVVITAVEHVPLDNGPAVTFTSLIPDLDHFHGRGGRVYPLWVDATATTPNLKPALLAEVSDAVGHAVFAEDMLAYIAGVMAHPAFTARFQKDLKQPGLRLPLSADASLFSEAVALGREVVWLHCYGERFADDGEGRPAGPPRMVKGIAPTIPKGGTIPGAPEPLPDDMTYDAGKQRLHIGKGFIDNVSQAMWDYEVSGKNVLRQWFSYRKRDRSRPVIGDRRPPSPLSQIQPDHWLPEYTTDLLNLLNVLGRLVALEPRQAELLKRICEAKLISLADLQAAGVIPIAEEAVAESGTEE